ncbi:unnamed protein product [Penicillium glandicola]
MESRSDAQILVHIAAASTAQDDARYRAQVAAILEFQCATRQPLMENKFSISNHDETQPFSAGAAHSSVVSTTQHEASPILREAPRPAFVTLSSDCHLVSERDGATPHKHIISNHSDSLESLISVIPDSQPEIAQLVHAEPSHAALSSPSQIAPPPKRRRTASASPNPAQPVSIIHSNPALATDQPAASHKLTPIHNHPLLPTRSHLPISSSDSHGPDDSTTNPPTTSSHHIERLNPQRTYKPSHQSRPLDPLERGYWLVQLAIEQPQHQDPVDPEDRPPNPNPNLGTNKPIQTPTPNSNQKLKKENPRAWPSPLFHAFWSFLSDFVGKDGRAGWGVWCILEAVPAPSASSDMHVSLKVYAWGEVAMHVYLLLFLASERRIRGMGIQWRDAGEEVVIQMP